MFLKCGSFGQLELEVAKMNKQTSTNTLKGGWHNEISLREVLKWDKYPSCMDACVRVCHILSCVPIPLLSSQGHDRSQQGMGTPERPNSEKWGSWKGRVEDPNRQGILIRKWNIPKCYCSWIYGCWGLINMIQYFHLIYDCVFPGWRWHPLHQWGQRRFCFTDFWLKFQHRTGSCHPCWLPRTGTSGDAEANHAHAGAVGAAAAAKSQAFPALQKNQDIYSI